MVMEEWLNYILIESTNNNNNKEPDTKCPC